MKATVEHISFAKVIHKLGWVSSDRPYAQAEWKDSDGHTHVILESIHTNRKQLQRMYENLLLSGNQCVVRSRNLRDKMIVEDWPEGVDYITIASVLQYVCMKPSDLRLMSMLTVWIDTPFFRF